jgi:hypothetical protein
MSTSTLQSAFGWPASDDAPVAYLLNYDVGADEALRLSRGEPFRGVDLLGGSMIALNNDPFLASGETGYSIDNAAGGATVVAARNTTDPIFGSADYKVEITAAGSSNGYPRVLFDPVRRNVPGSWRVQLWYQRVSGTQTTARLYLYNSGTAPFFAMPNFDGTVQYFEGVTNVVNPAGTSSPMVILQGNELSEFRFVCVITPLGLLDAPILQPCLATDDGTRQGMSRRLLGMSTVTEDKGAGPMPISVRRQDFTAATSVQILGGALTNKKARVVSVRGNSSASTTISLGTSTGGTQIVNAQAVNGDFDISTFASRILASVASLWVTFAANTTADLKITIEDL